MTQVTVPREGLYRMDYGVGLRTYKLPPGECPVHSTANYDTSNWMEDDTSTLVDIGVFCNCPPKPGTPRNRAERRAKAREGRRKGRARGRARR